MFHNILLTTLTPLQNTNEIHSWENRPFTTVWPEDQKRQDINNIRAKNKKGKRIRTAFTTEQLRTLENFFTKNRYIDAEKRRRLAKSLQLCENTIKIWFQNRRMKEKRESSESSSDTSCEITTSEVSPLQSDCLVPNQSEPQDLTSLYRQELSNPESRQIEKMFSYPEPPHYQVTHNHFCQSGIEEFLPTNLENNEHTVYPTEYYPTMEYYQNYQYDTGSTYSTETQWTANGFDLNFLE